MSSCARDPYEVLGVSRDASQDEIKVAYRKAAMKWHPDRWVSGSDEEKADAEEKFKEINAAYAILGDADKKRQYDTYGTVGDAPQMSDSEMEDMLNGMFGSMFGGMFGGGSSGMGGGRMQQRGRDESTTVYVTLEEMMNGADKTVTFTRSRRCHRCDGSGSEDNQTHTCPRCGGRGVVTERHSAHGVFMSQQVICPNCGGLGEVIEHKCPDCGGSGLETETVEMTLHIPAGIMDGAVSVVRGAGSAGPNRGPSGNLRVCVRLDSKDSDYCRVNNDLMYTHRVPFKTLVFGGNTEIPYIGGGSHKLHIEKGTESGKITRIYGKGFPDVNGGRRGDFIVRIECDIPSADSLTKKEADAIKSIG